jgi:hypothetical protein
VMEIHALLLERAHEAFGHAVTLGLPTWSGVIVMPTLHLVDQASAMY